MRWHHFLCCLPLRVGVILIALVTTVLSGAVAAVGWYGVHSINTDPDMEIPQGYKIGLYVVSSVYTVVTLICLLGLIGGLAAKRALVSLFSALQIGTFLLSLGAGAYTIYLLYSDKWQEQCKEFSSSSNTDGNVDYCINLNNTTKTVTVVIQVIYWIVQFYGLFIVHSYSAELKEKRYAGVKYATLGA